MGPRFCGVLASSVTACVGETIDQWTETFSINDQHVFGRNSPDELDLFLQKELGALLYKPPRRRYWQKG
jgi:hypothetical protein